MKFAARRVASHWRGRALTRAQPIVLLAVGGVCFASAVANSAVSTEPELGQSKLCQRYRGFPGAIGADNNAGMRWIPGGEITLGSQQGYPEERGGSRLYVPGFWIDRTEVTNAQFARFAQATGYVSVAERNGAAPVFHKPQPGEPERDSDYSWWTLTKGANWRHPEGPNSAISWRANHPVVQVAYADALAYAHWLGHGLPSEAQWEFAAKAQRDSPALHREPRDSRGRPLANFWQGEFPAHNTREDGFETSAPVGCYAANPFGLFDMLGNVWEWTESPYTSSHRADDAAAQQLAPAEHDVACSHGARSGARRVLKGGSFLCASNFCARYRVAARHAQEAEQPAQHIGFRTVREKR